MDAASARDSPWHSEKMFKGGSYFGRQDVLDVANAAYAKYINCNALYGGTIFPSLAKFDREVVGMVLGLLQAPQQQSAGGSLTTGGTESILLSVKTAVHWAREEKPHLQVLEIIVPHSCHPGFDKAAELLGGEKAGVRMVRLPSSGVDYCCNMDAMRAAITPSTIMLVGSAPSYPFGITDDIATMDALARQHDCWLHVDACNGGMLFPFARSLGRPVKPYDFALEGVRSISVDIHKLGYSNKGVSALLLRDATDEKYHRFNFSNWPSGLYSTASIAGSRSAGGVASAWAVMHFLGFDGYTEIVSSILAAADAFLAGKCVSLRHPYGIHRHCICNLVNYDTTIRTD
jgi:sphinganine-1-phosphate aldolase